MEINGHFGLKYGTRIVRCSKSKISRSLFSEDIILITKNKETVGSLDTTGFEPKFLKLNKLALYYDFLLKINEL